MRRPKVDLSGCTVLALTAAPKLANRQTGEVATNADGVPKYGVDLFIADPETEDSGTVKVTIASATPINVTPGTPVTVSNPRVMHWDANGRSGMAWSADAIATARPGGGRNE